MSGDKKARRVVRIVEDSTGVAVREFDVTNDSERQVDKMIAGLTRNMNHAKFSIVQVAA